MSAGAAIVYSLLFSTHLTEDSLWYARDILTPGRLYFHPHHLLYNPMMRALLSPVASLIREPEARLTYLQAWNVVFGAAAIAAYLILLLRLGCGLTRSIICASFLGLCAFSCRYASQIEVYSLTGLFLCVSLIGMSESEERLRGRLLTAAGFAAAMLFHQTAIFFGAAILTHAILTRQGGPARLLTRLAATLVAPLAAVGLIYAAVAFHLGHRDPVSFWRWMTLHVQSGYWGLGTFSEGTLLAAARRLAQATVSTGVQAVAFLLSLCLYVAGCLAAPRGGSFGQRRIVVVCLVWMSFLAAFTIWWDASGAEFWGMFLVPFFLVLTLTLPDEVALRSGPSWRRNLLRASVAAGLVVLVLSALTLHERNLQPDLDRGAARAARRLAGERDHLWAAGTDALTYDRIYLEGRPSVVAAINADLAREAGERSSPNTFTLTLVDLLEADARAARSQGGRCLIDRRVLEGAIKTRRLTRNLDLEEFRTELRRRFLIEPVGEPPDVFLYDLRPAQESAGSTTPQP